MNISQFGRIKRIHFIGIGGIGMSGIARILHSLGYVISGSDLKEGEVTRDLSKLGIRICIGHAEDNLLDAQVVVTSSAISKANGEYLAAVERGLTVIRRGEMLAELMRLKYGVAVAGTHGKTSTTALVAAIFDEAGLSPTTVVGGKVVATGSNATVGKSDFLICEADESDGSFLKLSPVLSVVTNIDLDHMDYYKTEEKLVMSFYEFIEKTPFFGRAVLCGDDARIRRLLGDISKPHWTYGFEANNHLQASNLETRIGGSAFDVFFLGTLLGRFELNSLGRHNVLNALAAIACGLEMGMDTAAMKRALSRFQGVNRRMSILGQFAGSTVVDDYGHHPTEIRATLQALGTQTKHITAIFQPHRYSRTLELYKDFANSFEGANEVLLTPIYPAGEKTIEGVSSEMILKSSAHENMHLFSDLDSIQKHLESNRHEDGIVLTIGAGDIYKFGQSLCQK